MPKKTFHQNSTLTIGDPDLGTGAWLTEYDVEYASKDAKDADMQNYGLSKPQLRTPRSLKKGYVFYKDYESLGGQYAASVSAYQDLQTQLASLEERCHELHAREEELLSSVMLEHDTVEDVKHKIEGLASSVGRLFSSVDNNRAMVKKLCTMQEIPNYTASTSRRPASAAPHPTAAQHPIATTTTAIATTAPPVAPRARPASAMKPPAYRAGAGTIGSRTNQPSGKNTMGLDVASEISFSSTGSRSNQRAPASGRQRRFSREEIEDLPATTTSQLFSNAGWKP